MGGSTTVNLVLSGLLLCILCITISNSSQLVVSPQTTVAPVRSYAQAAQGSNQRTQQPSQTNSHQASQQGQSWQPAEVQPVQQSPSPTQPPRSYAQAANNNNQHQQSGRPQQGGQNNQRPSAGQPNRGQSVTPSRSPAAANVTDDDLRNFSEDLLRSDANNAGSSVRTNWQARTYGSNPADLAPAPLLTVQARALQSPTITKLRPLFDNYEPDSARAETITPGERDENTALLDAIVATQVMSKTRQFLINKGLLSNSPGSLRTMLQQLWFTMYPRLGGRSEVGSSAFEHVFLAELRHGEVSGLHNWVFFAAEETSGKLNYLGYIRRIDLGGRGSIVKHHFKWSNITKPVGSMFIGTSPELEMSLYTVCYLARPDERCPMRLAGEPFFIKTHSFTYRGNKYIGSAFPDI